MTFEEIWKLGKGDRFEGEEILACGHACVGGVPVAINLRTATKGYLFSNKSVERENNVR